MTEYQPIYRGPELIPLNLFLSEELPRFTEVKDL